MENYVVPVVDFAACRIDVDFDMESEEVKRLADDVRVALCKSGVMNLINHGLATETLEAYRNTAKKFFELPESAKAECARQPDDAANGWISETMEKTVEDTLPDLKECYNMSYHRINTFPWPTEDTVPNFRKANLEFMENCSKLSRRLMIVLGLALSQEDPDLFVRAHEGLQTDANPSCARNVYYRPINEYADIQPGQTRLSAHVDFSTFTMLFQNNCGGLEGQAVDGTFYPTNSLEGGVMIQAGEFLERWTSGRIKALVHRVTIPPSDEGRNRARRSTVYFVLPDSEFIVRCLDGSETFPPVKTSDYMAHRMKTLQPGEYKP